MLNEDFTDRGQKTQRGFQPLPPPPTASPTPSGPTARSEGLGKPRRDETEEWEEERDGDVVKG